MNGLAGWVSLRRQVVLLLLHNAFAAVADTAVESTQSVPDTAPQAKPDPRPASSSPTSWLGGSQHYSVVSPKNEFKADDFVRREGTRLLLHGRPFRFGAANLPGLGMAEQPSLGFPSRFRIDDSLRTAALMGARVVRSHTLGISTGHPYSFWCNGTFNYSVLETVDYAVWRAGLLGLKLIVPLTDDWRYYLGGKHDFCEYRHANETDAYCDVSFYQNRAVVGDFKSYISALLEHRSSITGIAYKDDPTVMAWETGNELAPPVAWTAEICAHIKRISPNHLVVDGTYGIDGVTNSRDRWSNQTGQLQVTCVDIFSDHFYPMNASKLLAGALAVERAGRVYFAGEFLWTADQSVRSSLTEGNRTRFLAAVEATPVVAGAAYWSIFEHSDTGGFVSPYDDGMGLHFPGHDSARVAAVNSLRWHAVRMNGAATAPESAPLATAPRILSDVVSGTGAWGVVWRGVAGAARYLIESCALSSVTANDRECMPSGWKVLTLNATDFAHPIGWVDTERASQADPRPVMYRVRGLNAAGIAGPVSAPFKSVACSDVFPPSKVFNYTCAQQARFGKCGASWMVGYCCHTCFRCSPNCTTPNVTL